MFFSGKQDEVNAETDQHAEAGAFLSWPKTLIEFVGSGGNMIHTVLYLFLMRKPSEAMQKRNDIRKSIEISFEVGA